MNKQDGLETKGLLSPSMNCIQAQCMLYFCGCIRAVSTDGFALLLHFHHAKLLLIQIYLLLFSRGLC